jgi:hypothetical protein
MSKEISVKDRIVLFEDTRIRREWYNERWYFAVSDIVAGLIKGPDPKGYWRKLKQRLGEEGSEVVTFCHDLKMMATDGKY